MRHAVYFNAKPGIRREPPSHPNDRQIFGGRKFVSMSGSIPPRLADRRKPPTAIAFIGLAYIFEPDSICAFAATVRVNPTYSGQISTAVTPAICHRHSNPIRISAFGLLSDFGLRISAFIHIAAQSSRTPDNPPLPLPARQTNSTHSGETLSPRRRCAWPPECATTLPAKSSLPRCGRS